MSAGVLRSRRILAGSVLLAAFSGPAAAQSPGMHPAPLRLAMALPASAARPVPPFLIAPDPLPQRAAAGAPVPAPAQHAGASPASWEIAPGDGTLNATFSRWAASAGWQLVWEMDVDYAIQTRAVLQGTFDQAVARVAESLDDADVPMQAIFYAGNRVLRVVPKGSQ